MADYLAASPEIITVSLTVSPSMANLVAVLLSECLDEVGFPERQRTDHAADPRHLLSLRAPSGQVTRRCDERMN